MSSSEHDKAVERMDEDRREQNRSDATSRPRAGGAVRGESGGLPSRAGKKRARDSHLLDLEMQARYHRDRHRLYAARVGGSRPTSLGKLEELRRVRELSEGSLRRAEADRAQASS